MISIPLSLAGSVEQFARDVQQFIELCIAHQMGAPGKPAPRSSELVEAVVARIPADGPVATRGPDRFVAKPYQIFDDTPKTPEQQKAIDLLRETIG